MTIAQCLMLQFRSLSLFWIFLSLAASVQPVFSQQPAEGDTLLKLAIFPPEAKVYDRPDGQVVGLLGRGRVIRLLGAEGKWLNFTTREFYSAWIRWENTQTLEEWSEDTYEQAQDAIKEWEGTVKLLDTEIENALAAILNVEQQLSQGELTLDQGLFQMKTQRRKIEDSFRTLHNIPRSDLLSEAAEKLDSKRWAIDQGLNYLYLYIQNGKKADGDSASRYFKMAEDFTVQYSHRIFQLKSKYNLYPENNKR